MRTQNLHVSMIIRAISEVIIQVSGVVNSTQPVRLIMIPEASVRAAQHDRAVTKWCYTQYVPKKRCFFESECTISHVTGTPSALRSEPFDDDDELLVR